MTSPFVSLEQASAHIHRGAGPGSLQQAAGVWGVVAKELATAANAMLSVITSCGGQYWQGPAAQQTCDVLTSIAQGLKNNAVIAEQIKTAATTVAAAFHKAQAATPAPQHVADNRLEKAWLAAQNRLGSYSFVIAKLDAAYEDMWLESIAADSEYYYDTSHALQGVEQTWSPPHQQPAEASTTAGDHPPTHDALDISSKITQHRDTAALCRLYALDHAIETIRHQDAYEQHSTYARMCTSLADHGNATAEFYSKMSQLSRETVQVYKDLSLGRADMPALAQKYVDIATVWKRTQQQFQETIEAYHAAGETQQHLQELGNKLSEKMRYLAGAKVFTFQCRELNLFNPDLHSYTNSLQGHFERIAYAVQTEVDIHKLIVKKYAATAEDIKGYALDRAREADNAWRAAHQHAQSITDHAQDLVLLLQTAAREDNQATTLAGPST